MFLLNIFGGRKLSWLSFSSDSLLKIGSESGAARVPTVNCGNFNAGNGQSKEKKNDSMQQPGESLEKTETIGFWLVAGTRHTTHTRKIRCLFWLWIYSRWGYSRGTGIRSRAQSRTPSFNTLRFLFRALSLVFRFFLKRSSRERSSRSKSHAPSPKIPKWLKEKLSFLL